MEEQAFAANLSTQEKLLVAQAVYKFGALQWATISRTLLDHAIIKERKTLSGDHQKYFSPEACEEVYVGLMTSIGVNVPAEGATKPLAKIHLRLAQTFYLQRMTELKSLIETYENRFMVIMKDISNIKNGSLDVEIQDEMRGLLAKKYGKYGKEILDKWVPPSGEEITAMSGSEGIVQAGEEEKEFKAEDGNGEVESAGSETVQEVQIPDERSEVPPSVKENTTTYPQRPEDIPSETTSKATVASEHPAKATTNDDTTSTRTRRNPSKNAPIPSPSKSSRSELSPVPDLSPHPDASMEVDTADGEPSQSTRTSKRKASLQPPNTRPSKRGTGVRGRRGSSRRTESATPVPNPPLEDTTSTPGGDVATPTVDTPAPEQQQEQEEEEHQQEEEEGRRTSTRTRRESKRASTGAPSTSAQTLAPTNSRPSRRGHHSPAVSTPRDEPSPAISRSRRATSTSPDKDKEKERAPVKKRGRPSRADLKAREEENQAKEETAEPDVVNEEEEDDGQEERRSSTRVSGRRKDFGASVEAGTPAPERKSKRTSLRTHESIGDKDDQTSTTDEPTTASTTTTTKKERERVPTATPALSENLNPGESAPNSAITNTRRQSLSVNRNQSPRDLKSMQKLLLQLHEAIAAHRNGNVFMHPVRKTDASDYYDIIKKPIDLTKIKKRIRDGQITSIDDFQKDILLMFANAMMYNTRGSQVYTMAEEMLGESERQIKHFRTMQNYGK